MFSSFFGSSQSKSPVPEAKQEQTIILDPKDYVIVSIWASEENKALEGANVGHVSIETRFDYISLWPGPRPEKQTVDANETFAKLKMSFFRYFGERPTKFKQDYAEDCLSEAVSEGKIRDITHVNKCKPGEKAYIFNKEDLTFTPVETQPKYLESSEFLIAVEMLPASVRFVLYGLQVDKIAAEFKTLSSNMKGWRLAGSNALVRVFQEKTAESCASLAFRCLKAGGLYSKLASKVSSDTSSVVSPDGLIKHVLAYKEKELQAHPETKDWKCETCPNESSVEEVAKAYQQVGQGANAEKVSLLKKIFAK